jgi:uncharacterized SAM-binding protein YcdF (DUF218 family)
MSRRRRDIENNTLLRLIRFAAFLAVAIGLIGFAAFSGKILSVPTPSDPQADAIVVLTGGEGRLQRAALLLEDDRGARLLISGVHPDVTAGDIQTTLNADTTRFDCCVDLGREAADTAGNAREVSEWVSDNAYQSIIVVTSDYHLPRSLLELQALMPDTQLIAYPVLTSRPWTSLRSAQRWALEYFKYVAIWTREKLAGRA